MRCVLPEIGNHLQRLARLHVEHAHRARPHVRRVAAQPVVRNREHVALRLPGRNRAHDLQRLRIDDRDRVVQLRGHVEHPVLRPEDRAVRPHAVVEIDLAHNLVRGHVDHHDLCAVGSRLAHAAISVDGHKRQLPIRRTRNLVPGNAALGHIGNHFSGHGIDNRQAAIALLIHQQSRLLRLNHTHRQRHYGRRTNQRKTFNGNLPRYPMTICYEPGGCGVQGSYVPTLQECPSRSFTVNSRLP